MALIDAPAAGGRGCHHGPADPHCAEFTHPHRKVLPGREVIGQHGHGGILYHCTDAERRDSGVAGDGRACRSRRSGRSGFGGGRLRTSCRNSIPAGLSSLMAIFDAPARAAGML